MSVSCKCWVLSGRCLCDGPIPRPEETYRVSSVVCDLEASKTEAALARVGQLRHRKRKTKLQHDDGKQTPLKMEGDQYSCNATKIQLLFRDGLDNTIKMTKDVC